MLWLSLMQLPQLHTLQWIEMPFPGPHVKDRLWCWLRCGHGWYHELELQNGKSSFLPPCFVGLSQGAVGCSGGNTSQQCQHAISLDNWQSNIFMLLNTQMALFWWDLKKCVYKLLAMAWDDGGHPSEGQLLKRSGKKFNISWSWVFKHLFQSTEMFLCERSNTIQKNFIGEKCIFAYHLKRLNQGNT